MTTDEIKDSLRIIDDLLKDLRQDYLSGLTEQRNNNEVSDRIKVWETNKKLYIEQLKDSK
jgi:hypothetical protein